MDSSTTPAWERCPKNRAGVRGCRQQHLGGNATSFTTKQSRLAGDITSYGAESDVRLGRLPGALVGRGLIVRDKLDKRTVPLSPCHPLSQDVLTAATILSYTVCKTKRKPMEQVYIHPHATKHGLSKEQIRHAWENAVEVARRDRSDGITDYVAIGFDQSGRPLEMTARRKRAGFLIYHAKTPPTPRTFKELGLAGR